MAVGWLAGQNSMLARLFKKKFYIMQFPVFIMGS